MTVFSDRFAFVHIPKCGGHSCREYMQAHVPGMLDIEELNGPSPHLALRDFERWIGRRPDTFEAIFAVIRDPYAHQLSQWLFWRDMYAKGYEMAQHRPAAIQPDLLRWLLDPMSDWHVYDPRALPDGRRRTTASVKGIAGLDKGAGYMEFGGYYHYWLAIDGEIPDNVALVRQETLDRDFPYALKDIAGGIHPMPRSNTGPMHKPDVESYYSVMAMDIVEAKFAWAFDAGLYQRWKR